MFTGTDMWNSITYKHVHSPTLLQVSYVFWDKEDKQISRNRVWWVLKKSAKVLDAYTGPTSSMHQSQNHIVSSVAVLAEILLRSPRKLFIFIIKKIICRIELSKNKLI